MSTKNEKIERIENLDNLISQKYSELKGQYKIDYDESYRRKKEKERNLNSLYPTSNLFDDSKLNVEIATKEALVKKLNILLNRQTEEEKNNAFKEKKTIKKLNIYNTAGVQSGVINLITDKDTVYDYEYYAKFPYDIYERYLKNEHYNKYLPEGYYFNHELSDTGYNYKNRVLNIAIYYNEDRKEIVYTVRQTDFTNIRDLYANFNLLIKNLYGYVKSNNDYLDRFKEVIDKKKDYKIVLTGHSAGGSIILGLLSQIARDNPEYLDRIRSAYVYNPFAGLTNIDYHKELLNENIHKLKKITQIYNIAGDPVSYLEYPDDLATTHYAPKKTEDISMNPKDEHTIENFLPDAFIKKFLPHRVPIGQKIIVENEQVEIKPLYEINPSLQYIDIMPPHKKVVKNIPEVNAGESSTPQPTVEEKAKLSVSQTLPSVSQTKASKSSIEDIKTSLNTDLEDMRNAILATYAEYQVKGGNDSKEQYIMNFNKHSEKDPSLFKKYLYYRNKYREDRMKPVEQTSYVPREHVKSAPIVKEVITVRDGKQIKEYIQTQPIKEEVSKYVKIKKEPFEEKKTKTTKAYTPRTRPKENIKFTPSKDIKPKDKQTKQNPYNKPKKDSDRYQNTIIPLGKALPTATVNSFEKMKSTKARTLVKSLDKSGSAYKL
jgi:hypothetical protein